MDSIHHRGWLTIVVLTGVALGGCASAAGAKTTETGDKARVASQAIEEEGLTEPGAEPGQDEEGMGYGEEGIPEEGIAGGEEGIPGGEEGIPDGGEGDGEGGIPIGYVNGGGPGYVVGGLGYAVGGCDLYGNCFSQREWGGVPGGYGYGRSTSWSSQSGATCSNFGCVYY